jgi:arsenite methyltransferase
MPSTTGRVAALLSELFDGAGRYAVGLGARRLSEGLSLVLEHGDAEQRAAAQASAEAIKAVSRSLTIEFHGHIAEGRFTEESFLRGRALAERLCYPAEVLDRLPDRAVERFIGLANPFVFGRAKPGEFVVDVGCGAGLDSTVAAFDVGPSGLVLGLDATFMMAKVASEIERPLAAQPVYGQSLAEFLPVRSDSADLVTSNGVFNLCDRPVVLRECLRILKPGGRLQFGDLALDAAGFHELAAEWWSFSHNRLTIDRWRDLLTSCGFVDVEIGAITHPGGLRSLAPMVGRSFYAAKPR